MDSSYSNIFKRIQKNNPEKYSVFTSFLDSTISNPDIFPCHNLVFNALHLCPLNSIKVVILGQDPYHSEGQAMGLSFSVPENTKIPPSLKNIYKCIHNTSDISMSCDSIDLRNGDLTHWAKQGVLLLNTSLTVLKNKPGSHKKQWEWFIREFIFEISRKRSNIVFLLWGNHAKSLKEYIYCRSDPEKQHNILEYTHPSPLSRKSFNDCKNFKETNLLLLKNNKTPIIR